MAYHFRRPARGEVFVFSTAGITGIVPPPGIDSQHYIKRLTALPGDRLQLKPTDGAVSAPRRMPQPNGILNINGEPAKEAGMNKVMSRQNGYRGYTLVDGGYVAMDREVQLPEKRYMAMGDNSFDSSDSRYWGPVPEENLVGPALFVYWPFLPHFGLIR
jgi:signal peptidase I